MHDRDWTNGMGGGWWWMAIMMLAILGALVWIGVTLIRHGNHTAPLQTHGVPPIPPARPTPHELLAERLARGEIDPDDYRQRLDALKHPKE